MRKRKGKSELVSLTSTLAELNPTLKKKPLIYSELSEPVFLSLSLSLVRAD